jgi:glycosyltransferase involved in cell wall biosynthesis
LSELKNDPVALDIYGNNMNSLKAKATTLQLDNVMFKGSVGDVTQHMDGYSAFVITSSSGEGFSLALLEAMGSGLPVICSDIPQFVEAVNDAAVIFKTSDVSSLVRQVRSLIGDPNRLRAMSSQSMERAAMFSRQRFSDAMSDIYKNTTPE